MEMSIKEAIERLDWYFTADDGSAAEEETKLAYATVKQKIEKDALAQFREQEPQSVIFDRQCKAAPDWTGRKGFCPKCHQWVLWMVNREYCGFCGQEVKWD